MPKVASMELKNLGWTWGSTCGRGACGVEVASSPTSAHEVGHVLVVMVYPLSTKENSYLVLNSIRIELAITGTQPISTRLVKTK